MRRALPVVIIALSILAVTARPAKAVVTVPEYRQALEHVYQYRAHGGDYRAFGGAAHGRDRLARWRAQAKGPVARGYMRRLTRERKAAWRFHRSIDRITPYGEWAVPGYIVACESGGSYTASNPSGAYGAYQVMPGTAAAYGCSLATPAGQHVCGARIWAGQGPGAWVCA